MKIQEAIQKAIGKNDFDVFKDFCGIKITSKGLDYGVLVDHLDLKDLLQHRWHLTEKGYAIAWINNKRTKMHHFIMGKPKTGLEVDHINRNRLDNRRQNLRFVPRGVNAHNTAPIGVRKHGKRWEANICLNYKKYFKSFSTQKEALQWRQEMKNKYLNK